MPLEEIKDLTLNSHNIYNDTGISAIAGVVYTDQAQDKNFLNDKRNRVLFKVKEQTGEYISHLNYDLYTVDACKTASTLTIKTHPENCGGITVSLMQEFRPLSRRQFYELVHSKLLTVCNLMVMSYAH